MESEIRILEINKEKFIEQIEKLGAKKKDIYFYKRYVYDFHPVQTGKGIRLHTNGEETTFKVPLVLEGEK